MISNSSLNSFVFSLLVIFPALAQIADATTTFTYGNDLTCDSPITVTVGKASCRNGEICTFGDKLSTYGTITLDEDLSSSEVCVDMKVCLYGKSWMCKTYSDQFDVCTDLNLEGVNGEKCPEAGTYTYDAELSIPSVNANLGNGWWALAKMTLTNCADTSTLSVDCSASIISASSGGSSSSSAYIAGGALLGISTLLALFFVRRRRSGTIDLRKEEQLVHADGHFEMLNDSVRV